MYIEHLIYSTALAVIVGMIFSRYTGRDLSWIIIAVAFVPDIDQIFQIINKMSRNAVPVAFHHGDLHNILFLIVFSLLFAWALHFFGIRFIDGLICSAIGIAAHFFEDALVFNPAYAFLWPITTQKFGIGFMTETTNIFRIANSVVLLNGIILLTGVMLVRTLIDGTGWWRIFLYGGRMGTQST